MLVGILIVVLVMGLIMPSSPQVTLVVPLMLSGRHLHVYMDYDRDSPHREDDQFEHLAAHQKPEELTLRFQGSRCLETVIGLV